MSCSFELPRANGQFAACAHCAVGKFGASKLHKAPDSCLHDGIPTITSDTRGKQHQLALTEASHMQGLCQRRVVSGHKEAGQANCVHPGSQATHWRAVPGRRGSIEVHAGRCAELPDSD